MIVEFAKNFTDVDDKNQTPTSRGELREHITTTFIKAYYDDMDKLGVRRATLEPRATEHIADIVALVDTLMAKGWPIASKGMSLFGGSVSGVWSPLQAKDG